MTILLTKDMRHTILTSVMKKTNFEAEKKDILARTSEIAHQLVLGQIPTLFWSLVQGQPKEWFAQISSLGWPHNNTINRPVGRDQLPEAVMDVHGRSYAYSVSFEPIACPISFEPAFIAEPFAGVIAEAAAWRERYDSVRGEMHAFLQSQRSVESLVTAMPEIEEFIPVKKAKTFALVAPSNLLSSLTAAGFPDGNNTSVAES